MRINNFLIASWIFAGLLSACSSGPDQAGGEQDIAAQSGEEPTQFNGVWTVIGRTGNEDGSNKPVCGYETGLGIITIEGSKITGSVTNKSGFEYTVEGKIFNSGDIKAMLIYQGYDAAELFGTFSAETNSAKGNWKDAVNACPGVWTATRDTSTAELKPAAANEGSAESPASEQEQPATSG